jgi:lipopolysaccharide export system protein LptA
MSADLITASGGAPLATSSDGSLRLSASRIILRLTKTKGRQGISTAEAVGGVKLHALQAPGQDMDAVCDKAVINPSLHRAELTGSVRVRRWDKAKFSGPLELTGDAVTMDLKNGRVVATSHTSKSHFSATPKSGGKP